MPRLTGIPPYISLLYKTDTLLTKQGGLISEVIGSIKKELDKRNIGGGYNTTQLMWFFKSS